MNDQNPTGDAQNDGDLTLTGSGHSRLLAAAGRAITASDPFRHIPDPSASIAEAKRNERLSLVAGSLAGGMIAQRAGKEPVTPAQAVTLWRDVFDELRGKNAAG